MGKVHQIDTAGWVKWDCVPICHSWFKHMPNLLANKIKFHEQRLENLKMTDFDMME